MTNNCDKSGLCLILVSIQSILNLPETLYWYAFQKFRHLIAKKKNFKHSNKKTTKVETPNLYFFLKKNSVSELFKI